MNETSEKPRIIHSYKSKTVIDTKESTNINVEEELERFVSQIEENTFAILSIKQKFALIQKNTKLFTDETVEKLDSFEKEINLIENQANVTFNRFNQRLDHMELLGFQPATYHPSKTITISDNYQITTAFFSSDLVFIGTDTSRIIIISGKTMQLNNEIGPLDGSAVVQIGLASRTDNQVLAAKTSSNTIHIIDIQRPSQKRTIQVSMHATWPANLPSPYRMVTFEGDRINFYDDSLTVAYQLKISAQKFYPGPDRLIVTNDETISIYNLLDDIRLQRNIRLPFKPKLINSSRTFFVASGDCNDIAIVDFDGDFRLVDVGGPSKFLFTWGSYYFRIGENTLIEYRDVNDKTNKMTQIGDPVWWPHSMQSPLATCAIMESTLITAGDLKCVLWN